MLIRINLRVDDFTSFTFQTEFCFYRNLNNFKGNSNFLIPIFLQSNGVNCWYFKPKLITQTELTVWNIIRSTSLVAKIILWPELNSFTWTLDTKPWDYLANITLGYFADLMWKKVRYETLKFYIRHSIIYIIQIKPCYKGLVQFYCILAGV